ncbi:hypothetical protein HMPREF9011_01380 [Bacteroides sp. 3_1_40A]|jgi:hypothetical protein|nr:hypothetical protein HMPREF9011_01380 [Bacteroides sp. 3_1_40A]
MNTKELYQHEIKQVMAIIQSDETKNEAKCILANLCTIVKYYGNTTTAQYIKYSCDNCILGYNNKLNTFFDVGRNTEQIKGTYADALASKKR